MGSPVQERMDLRSPNRTSRERRLVLIIKSGPSLGAGHTHVRTHVQKNDHFRKSGSLHLSFPITDMGIFLASQFPHL